MPTAGVFRAGRWSDVQTFPAPAQPMDLALPLHDGYRWEDAFGEFATAKCSASAEAAIGRTIARYRRRIMNDKGSGIIDAIMSFMSGPPDDGEPELGDGHVPPDVFDDLYIIRAPSRPVVFIDLGHDETRRLLETQLGETLEKLGIADLNSNLAREPDRRVTRLALRALHSLCADGRFGPVAGIYCPGQPDADWAAYVLWSPPQLVTLTDDDVEFRWLARWDKDVIAAAERLGVELPV